MGMGVAGQRKKAKVKTQKAKGIRFLLPLLLCVSDDRGA